MESAAEKMDSEEQNMKEDEEILNDAKAYLMKSTEPGMSVWEFLTYLVDKLLNERPKNAYDRLEYIIYSLKKEKAFYNRLKETPTPQVGLKHAKTLMALLSKNPRDKEWLELPDQTSPWSDVIHQLEMLKRLAGVTMPDTFVLQLSLSVRRFLQENALIRRARFWGRVGGCYYVLEAELTEEGYRLRREEMDEARVALEAAKTEQMAEVQRLAEELAPPGDVTTEEAPLILSPCDELKQNVTDEIQKLKTEIQETLQNSENFVLPLAEVPVEPPGTGVNRMVYYVCEEPGNPDSWKVLPDVTPQQLWVARRITKLLSGDLHAEILSYPPFPGNEASYLRAQIARISASTHVAPAGFYKLRRVQGSDEEPEDEDEEEGEEEEEEDDDEDVVPKEVAPNSRYLAPSMTSLLDLGAWVHYTPHILQQQCRTVWWNPGGPEEEEPEEEEESEEENEDEEATVRGSKAEHGPRPLDRLSEDRAVPELVPNVVQCWAVRAASTVVGPPAVVMRSLLWPGAYTVASGRRLEHIYMGWGFKTSGQHFQPLMPPNPCSQAIDLDPCPSPTLEEERAAAEAAKEEQEEDEEEEEDDDD